METEIVACIVTEPSSGSALEHHDNEATVAISSPERLKPCGQHLLLRKRKQLNAFVAPTNPYHLTTTYARRVSKPCDFPLKLDAVTQRVLSGKEHRIKQLQSDLGIAQNKICELLTENRLLRSLHKRNEAVLNRFQNVEAELPSLLSQHNSEIKSLRERFQKLSVEHREQARELRGKDAVLQATREQVVNLNKLIEDRNLKERQELANKLEEATEKITELEQRHKTLSRQLFLDKKSFRYQLAKEQKRYGDLKSELHTAEIKIANLENKLKGKEKFITDHLTRKEFHQHKNVSPFKGVLSNSEHRQKSSGTIVQKQVHNAATPHTSSSGAQDQEEDYLSSNLSFDQGTNQLAGSIMNQLNYTSSDSDEDVNEIYRSVRPTSVPQLSLHTTASTPWAVDSRTFSVRQPSYFSSQDVRHSSLQRQSTVTITTAPSSATISSAPVIGSDVKSKSNESLVKDEPTIGTTKLAIERQTLLETGSENSRTITIVENTTNVADNYNFLDDSSESKVSSNYSKEALLAALKAIDVKYSPETSEQPLQVPFISTDTQNLSKRKTELMHELFSAQETEDTDVFSSDKNSITN